MPACQQQPQAKPDQRGAHNPAVLVPRDEARLLPGDFENTQRHGHHAAAAARTLVRFAMAPAAASEAVTNPRHGNDRLPLYGNGVAVPQGFRDGLRYVGHRRTQAACASARPGRFFSRSQTQHVVLKYRRDGVDFDLFGEVEAAQPCLLFVGPRRFGFDDRRFPGTPLRRFPRRRSLARLRALRSGPSCSTSSDSGISSSSRSALSQSSTRCNWSTVRPSPQSASVPRPPATDP